jgi:hypothetical protein
MYSLVGFLGLIWRCLSRSHDGVCRAHRSYSWLMRPQKGQKIVSRCCLIIAHNFMIFFKCVMVVGSRLSCENHVTGAEPSKARITTTHTKPTIYVCFKQNTLSIAFSLTPVLMSQRVWKKTRGKKTTLSVSKLFVNSKKTVCTATVMQRLLWTGLVFEIQLILVPCAPPLESDVVRFAQIYWNPLAAVLFRPLCPFAPLSSFVFCNFHINLPVAAWPPFYGVLETQVVRLKA